MDPKNKKTSTSVLREKLASVDDIWSHLHRVLLFATLLAGVFAVVLESHSPSVSQGIVIATFVANIGLLVLRAILEPDEDLSLFTTFWLDYLRPPKRAGKELEINIDVAIVEEKGKERFKNVLSSKFKPKRADNTENALRINWKSVPWSPESQDLTDKRFKRLKRQVKAELKKRISRSEAVAFVCIEEPEKNSWVHESLTSWASKNASVPVLAIKPTPQDAVKDGHKRAPGEILEMHETIPESKPSLEAEPVGSPAENFLWLSDNAKVFPWGMLRRGLDRASSWRTQARYNRAMAFSILCLSLIIIIVGYQSVTRKKETYDTNLKNTTKRYNDVSKSTMIEYRMKVKELYDGLKIRSALNKPDKPMPELVREYESATNGISYALETKSRFQKEILESNEQNLHVSYFIRSNNKAYVFVTTETEITKDNFDINKESLTGCVFGPANQIIQWAGAEPQVFDLTTEKEITNHGCKYGPRSEPIRQIACSASLSSDTDDRDATVGVCIFTGTETNILAKEYKAFLRARTIEFSNDFRSAIKDKTLITLFERREKEKGESPQKKSK